MCCRHVLPKTAYRGFACMLCGADEIDLLQCSRCKRVSYCDEHCQKADYPEHKGFCRAWTAVRAEESIIERTGEEDRAAVEKLADRRSRWTMGALQDRLEGPLSIVDKFLVVYEPRCAICFRTEDDLRRESESNSLPGEKMLTFCPQCMSTFACPGAHAEMVERKHDRIPYECDHGVQLTRCDMHGLAFMDDENESCCCENDDKGIWFPERRRLKYAPFRAQPGKNTWMEWFSLPESQWPHKTLSFFDVRLVSAALTFPMTILHGIQLFEDPKCHALFEVFPGSSSLPAKYEPLHTRSRLEIHVIGMQGSDYVAKQAVIFEELQHLLPECKQLVVRFVGPDLVEFPSLFEDVPHDFDDMTIGCAHCRSAGATRTQSIHPYFYHSWVQERRNHEAEQASQWTKPDIAVCFNPSISEYTYNSRLWAQTISLLLDMRVPTLVTAFSNREALSDRGFVDRLGGLVVSDPQRNPWRDEVCLPEYIGNDEFYYFNNFVFGFVGRKADQVA